MARMNGPRPRIEVSDELYDRLTSIRERTQARGSRKAMSNCLLDEAIQRALDAAGAPWPEGRHTDGITPRQRYLHHCKRRGEPPKDRRTINMSGVIHQRIVDAADAVNDTAGGWLEDFLNARLDVDEKVAKLQPR